MGYGVVSADKGRKLIVTLRSKATKAAIDLTGKTAELRYRIDGGALFTRSMTVDPDQVTNKGKASYQFAGVVDLPLSGTRGTLQGEVLINAGQPDEITNELPFALEVRARLS